MKLHNITDIWVIYINIKTYHCDNGIFPDNIFKYHITSKEKTVSYCGVNEHFQNGKSEKRIMYFQENARVTILHAQMRWNDVITQHVFLYELIMSNKNFNDLPRTHDGISPT